MIYHAAYWSRGAGPTKRAEPFVFVLIFCFFCIKTKEKENVDKK
jgi:hypothetical protein